ncbi:hypothetical protein [Streptomyces sp. NPDC005374]|uniref:hypothetical protein n=1 Tax=Streptomyces sp. NPDC005374 TaxID=3364713 RepID=UPI0036C5BE4E
MFADLAMMVRGAGDQDGDAESARTRVYDYYSLQGEDVATLTSSAAVGSTGAAHDVVKQYEDLGVDELFFNPTIDDLAEVERLAEAVR